MGDRRSQEWRLGITLSIAIAAAVLTPAAQSQKLVTPGYLFNSDPICHAIDGKFYLFTTEDPSTVEFIRPNGFYKGMFAWHALSTTDFDHWVDHGSILTGKDARWNTGHALWDGDAGIEANGRFYAYAPFRVNAASEANYGVFEVGVFAAARPIGPYKDVLGGPMKLPDGQPLVGLSPAVVHAANGAPWLIWGSGDTNQHQVMLARLNPDMTQLAEPPRILAVPQRDACGNLEYFESPILFRVGKLWYLTFVAYKDKKGPGCDAQGSWVDYSVSDSMFGPFNGPVRHLIYPTGDGEESVQQGVCSYRGHRYLAYHVPYETVVGEHDHHRQVAVTSLVVLPDGSLRPVIPGRDVGVGTPEVTHLTLDAFAPRRDADEFQVRLNAEGERADDGGFQMKMGDGGYLEFRRVDFGKGASAFRVEVSSGNESLRNGTLQVRLDNPAGQIIAQVAVTNTGGPLSYRMLTVPVSPGVRGVHNLCLVAHGDSSPSQRRIFNITWFSFIQRLSGKRAR